MVRAKLNLAALFSFLFTFLLLGDAFGQAMKNVSVTGQVRHRTEMDAKDFDSDSDNVVFHLLRTRLNVAATPAEDVKAFIQVQDSRVFGSETGTIDGMADYLDMHQAYFQVANLFDTELIVRVGRQEINIGNQRLVGAVGWHNIGRSFDGMRLMYDMEGGSLQILAARLVGATSVPTGQNLYGFVGAFPVSDGHNVEVVALLDNDTEEISSGPSQGDHVLSRYTVGATARGMSGTVDYEVEAYFQGGDKERGSLERASISGTLISAKAGVLVSEEKNARVGALVTIVSGDDDSSDDEFGAFNTLFATNHKFYGYMDYFLSFGSAAGVGLRDFSVSGAFNPSEAFRLGVDVHKFFGDQVPDGVDDDFGTEIDVTGSYKYNSAFSITVGVSMFTPGDLMKSFRGEEDNAFWAYIMTVVNL